jgi:hypothetical protein
VDDSGAARTGMLNIPYATTSSNNVVATSSPSGEIEAVEKSGSQAVAVDFTTDDGRAASSLLLTTNLSTLPAGWHSSAASFSCASVGTGNGCQLPLTYGPTALGSGMLRLDYAYNDDAGNPQTGTLNVPYTATTNDNVVATPSPAGQINAVVGHGSQNVAVVFTTDDARLATALQITSDLSLLPAGWSAPGSFTCATLSTGSTCQLALTYTPAAYTVPGTLVLAYRYQNNAGQMRTGSIDIPYRATTDDTIAGAASPPSLAVIIGSPTAPAPVTITFTTDDGNPAVGLPATSDAFTITSGLNPLPAGWSSSSTTFSCLTVSDGTGCQLPLSYQPAVVTGGVQTLTLGYSYVNDAGFAKTGTATVGYRAMSNNSVQGSVSPVLPLLVSSGSTTPVVVSFTTSDGNPASGLVLTPSSIPAGWSIPSPMSCTSVDGTAATCQFSLSYQPLMPDSGTLSLGYSYTNNAGQAGSGTLTIQYSAN